MKNNYFSIWMMSTFLLATFSQASQAAPVDADKPVTIEANSAQMDDQNGLSIYSGNVTITQGSLQITAEKVTAYHEGNGMSKIIADGNPAHYEQADNGKDGPVNASANTIDYLTDQRKIILTGNAKLEQQGNTVQGQKITYDMQRKTGSASSSSGAQKENGRVKMIFQPKSSSTPKPTTEVKKP